MDRPEVPHESAMAGIVQRNIAALLRKRYQQESHRRLQDKIADSISRFAGSMACVYIHAIVVLIWIAINLGWIPHVPRFDPTFVLLAMVASVEAIFLSTFVLITQNRMAELADRRADLDLQISLLAEHEVTRLLTLVRSIAGRMGIEEAGNPELNELSQDVAPEKVLDTIERESSHPDAFSE